MADTAVKEKVEAGTDGGGSSKKMLLVGLFIGVAVVAAYFLLFAKAPAAEDGEAAVEEPAAIEASEGAVFEVATLTVNLDSDELRYGRVQFGVLAAALIETDLTLRFPLLQDRAISTIAGFTPDELRTVAGQDRLREALTQDAQVIWPDGEVLRVVLYDLIVQ